MKKAFETFVVSIVSSIVLMIALTLLDVWVVHILLFQNGLLPDFPFFWWIPFWVMEFSFPLCLILMFENKIPLTCYLFFVLGGEDTLYHLFAAGQIPEVYPGIYFLGVLFSPTRELVLGSFFVSVFLSLFIFHLEYEKIKRGVTQSPSILT